MLSRFGGLRPFGYGQEVQEFINIFHTIPQPSFWTGLICPSLVRPAHHGLALELTRNDAIVQTFNYKNLQYIDTANGRLYYTSVDLNEVLAWTLLSTEPTKSSFVSKYYDAVSGNPFFAQTTLANMPAIVVDSVLQDGVIFQVNKNMAIETSLWRQASGAVSEFRDVKFNAHYSSDGGMTFKLMKTGQSNTFYDYNLRMMTRSGGNRWEVGGFTLESDNFAKANRKFHVGFNTLATRYRMILSQAASHPPAWYVNGNSQTWTNADSAGIGNDATEQFKISGGETDGGQSTSFFNWGFWANVALSEEQATALTTLGV